MRKVLFIFLIIFIGILPSYCTIDEKENINIETKREEIKHNKEYTDKTRVSTEKFEYENCKGNEKIKACKIEDLIKKDDKKSNKLP